MCKYCKVNKIETVDGKEVKNYFGEDFLEDFLILETKNLFFTMTASMSVMGDSNNPSLYFEVAAGDSKETLADERVSIIYCPFCGRKLTNS